MHWTKAAFAYFLALFGAGFVLGSVRVLLLLPRVGVRVAELIEMPLMVLLTIIAARWIVLCFGSPSMRRRPLRMGFLALLLMVAAEISLGSLAGATVPEYITARDPVSGTAYFVALVFFSLAPWLVVRRTWRRSTAAGSIDEFIPQGDVEENHEIVIRAPADLVFEVAEHFDLLSAPVVRSIFRLREMTFGLRSKPRAVSKGLVAELTELGWRMLAYRPGRELVMGAVTQPWVGDVKFRGIPADSFVGFAEPSFVKIVWTFEAEPLNAGMTRFRSQTRVLATDKQAHRKFMQYWVFAGPFIVLIRKLANRAIRRAAEARFSRIQASQPSPSLRS